MEMKFKKKIEGYSLVEVLLASAIVIVVFFSALALVSTLKNSTNSAQDEITFELVKFNLFNTLLDSGDCISSLVGGPTGLIYNGQEASIQEVKFGSQDVLAAKSNYNGIKIGDIKLLAVPGISSTQSASVKYHLANLVINAEKMGASLGGSAMTNASAPFQVFLATDQDDKVISCSSLGLLETVKTCDTHNLVHLGQRILNGELYNVHLMARTYRGVGPNRAPSKFFQCQAKVGQRFGTVSICNDGTSCF